MHAWLLRLKGNLANTRERKARVVACRVRALPSCSYGRKLSLALICAFSTLQPGIQLLHFSKIAADRSEYTYRQICLMKHVDSIYHAGSRNEKNST